MINTRPRCIALTVLMWASDAATGTDTALPDEGAFLYQPPVVLSASRLEQPQDEAPVTLTIIDREMIEASGARHIAELLRMVPGFQVAQVRGQDYVVGYHGLTGDNSKNLQVLVDGRSVYSLIRFGGANWFTLPYALDDIERIEVVQGSNSAAYGANAFLGVANIITRKAAGMPAARARMSAGSRDLHDGSVHLGAAAGNLALRLTAGRHGDDGLEAFSDDTSLSRYVNARAEWNPSAQDEITLLAGSQRGLRAQGRGTLFDPQRKQSADAAFAQLRWRRTLSPNSEIAFQYYHNRDTLFEHQIFELPMLGRLVQDVGVKAHRDHAEFQHIFAPGPRLRVVWGLEGRQDQATSRFFFGNDNRHHATLWRAFGNLEWRLRADTVANLGATVERYNLTGTRTAPRLSLSHHLTPEHTLRYAYTTAFLTPTLGEVQGNERYVIDGTLYDIILVGNPDLEPARLRAQELGYIGELRSLGLRLNARLFREKIEGLFAERRVSTAPETEVFNPEANLLDNLEDPVMRGLEYQARIALGAFGNLLVNQSFIEIEQPQRVYRGGDRYAQSAPARALYVLLDARLPAGIRAGLSYRRVSDMHWLGFGDVQPAHSNVDLRLAKDFRWSGMDLQFALVARNLLDERHSEYRPENVIRPRYFAALAATF